ncbi:MoxR family ATPase [Persicimonas caeni]|uniref:MoxR family ATPase n=1 Tax=Persicimonas caeni TaxID=2292766 RepID=A0A4Y6PMZ8_PERCE|nr:MoxR family ATPase [Persicimonas caeni]QED30893.1 MoxR family ATPase [Persicimonas caeni]
MVQSSTKSQSPPVETVSLDRLTDLQANVESVFQGKTRVVRYTLACLLAGGHVLLEDVPGVGKTTLALALARSMGLSFQRIQFTSDLLPSDIIGVSVYRPETGDFDFKPGPLFAGVILADEINRTTPRTQSALLEAMSEGKVSVDNVTHQLPDPFLVIATQNPLEHHGTYPLPESQLDRFLMRLSIGYPSRRIERQILLERRLAEPVHELEAALDVSEFRALQQKAARVRLDETLVDYLMEVVDKTRRDTRVRIGVSTRGALAMARVARAWALVQGRDFCIPDDLRELFVPCFAHRLALAGSAGDGDKDQAEMVMEELVSEVPTPT